MNQRQKKQNQKTVNFDSFSEAEKELNKYYAGMARILDGNLITNKDNMPESYKEKYNLTYDKYLVLEAEKNDSIIEIVVPISHKYKKGDLEYCLEWTGAHSIDYLAGKRIPVRHIVDDVFRVEKFNSSVIKYFPISIIKKLISKNIIKQKVYGSWFIRPMHVYLMYTALLIPLLIVSYIIGELVSIHILTLIIPYLTLKLLKHKFSR